MHLVMPIQDIALQASGPELIVRLQRPGSTNTRSKLPPRNAGIECSIPPNHGILGLLSWSLPSNAGCLWHRYSCRRILSDSFGDETPGSSVVRGVITFRMRDQWQSNRNASRQPESHIHDVSPAYRALPPLLGPIDHRKRIVVVLQRSWHNDESTSASMSRTMLAQTTPFIATR